MKFAFVCSALCSASIAALAVPTVASAAVLVSGSVTGIDVPSDPGLALEASAIAFADFSLNNVGETFTTDVLRIGTRENTVNLADDLVAQPVSATFAFFIACWRWRHSQRVEQRFLPPVLSMRRDSRWLWKR